MLAPSRVGAVTISGQRLPVLAFPNSRGHYVEKDGLVLSVEGAKTFKRGAYPLHASLQPVVAAEVSHFAARDTDAQTDSTRVLLRATLSRLIDVGFPTVGEN